MSFVYRETYVEAGGTVMPWDWLVNMGALASEMNGYLDRDNFPENVLTAAMIVDNAFNRMGSEQTSDSTAVTLDGNVVEWQVGDNGGLPSITVTFEHDGVLKVRFGGRYDWGASIPISSFYKGVLQFRIRLDGVVIAQTGYLPLMRLRGRPFLTGTTQVSAGRHVIDVEARMFVTGFLTTSTVAEVIRPEAIGATGVDVKSKELQYKYTRR